MEKCRLPESGFSGSLHYNLHVQNQIKFDKTQ